MSELIRVGIESGQRKVDRSRAAEEVEAISGETAIKVENMQQAHNPFLEIFGNVDDGIPSVFGPIFEIAKNHLVKTSTEPKAGTDNVETNFTLEEDPYDLDLYQRPAKGLADLASVPIETVVAEGPNLPIAMEEGAIKIYDFRNGQTEGVFNRPISRTPDTFNTSEQSIYVLVDLSHSMTQKHRMVFSQTLILWYLHQIYVKQGRKPHFHLRGFADDMGALVSAKKMADLDKIIDELLAAEARQRGTDIQGAIIQAASDIRYHDQLNGAEIVLLTDGIANIDPQTIKDALGKEIKLHTMFVGDDRVLPFHSDEPAAIGAYVAKLKGIWDEVSDTLIQLPDVDGFTVSKELLAQIEGFLNDHVLSQSVQTSNVSTKRRAVYLADLIDVLIKEQSECTTELASLKSRIINWLRGRDQIEILAELARGTRIPPKERASLRKQQTALNVALTRRKTGRKVMINRKELVIKLLIALLKAAKKRFLGFKARLRKS